MRRARPLLLVPALVLAVGAPLAACATGPEPTVCGVLAADGDDYLEVDARTCPPPGLAGPPQGPLWVPVSALDGDRRDTVRVVTVPPKASVPKSTTRAPAKPTTRPRSTSSR